MLISSSADVQFSTENQSLGVTYHGDYVYYVPKSCKGDSM